jgi:hypothetical protein
VKQGQKVRDDLPDFVLEQLQKLDHVFRSPETEDRVEKRIVEGSECLVLPKGMKWPIAESRVLFVREHYKNLFENVLHRCKRLPVVTSDAGTLADSNKADASNFRFVIEGQPGIGKSVFGWFLVYRLRNEQPDRAVIYASNKWDRNGVLFPGGKGPVRKIQSADLKDFVDRYKPDDCVLICDSFLPAEARVPTVVISSPGRMREKGTKDKLNKYNHRLWMPIPSNEEVDLLRQAAFPDAQDLPSYN